MGIALQETPPRAIVRLRKYGSIFYVLARNGKGWKVINKAQTRNEALAEIEKYHTDKDARWSLDVRMKDFFACVCGERVKGLLEAHHIKPKEQFPELRHDLTNGEYDCLWRHAFMHRDNPVVMNMILLRLVRFLTKRRYCKLSKCQSDLLGNEEETTKKVG